MLPPSSGGEGALILRGGQKGVTPILEGYLVGSECGLFAICTNFAFKSPDRRIIGRAMARWKALEL